MLTQVNVATLLLLCLFLSDVCILLKEKLMPGPFKILVTIYFLIYMFLSLVTLFKLEYTYEIISDSKHNLLCLLDLACLLWYVDLRMYFSY